MLHRSFLSYTSNNISLKILLKLFYNTFPWIPYHSNYNYAIIVDGVVLTIMCFLTIGNCFSYDIKSSYVTYYDGNYAHTIAFFVCFCPTIVKQTSSKQKTGHVTYCYCRRRIPTILLDSLMHKSF